MKVAILSDIHGNLEALETVCKQIAHADSIILLGDIIDYCQHSNEVISILRKLDDIVVCNIWGNHEEMILNDDYNAFDLERGVVCAKHTKRQLTVESVDYLNNFMTNKGMKEFELEGKMCLAVHGSLADNYWQSIDPIMDLPDYMKYDYVFSGHSHIPHMFEKYYPSENREMRNKKKAVFINPGSVGQPRNHSPLSQFVILDTDTGEVSFRRIPYDVEKEQSVFNGQVDDFYRVRLEYGV